MVHLYDKETGAKVGRIDEQQFRFLQDQLEEESERDNDYYINAATIEMFSERGADRALLGLLRTALDGRKEMEIRWQR
jgi:hypothetical protein